VGTKHESWFHWETDVQSALDLNAMPGSGNQWHAPSDGTTVGHWTETRWPIMVDCKHTTQKSFSVARKVMDQWVKQAMGSGKRFALPIRFEDENDTHATRSDYVVIPMDDYAELVKLHREGITPPSITREEVKLLTAVATAVTNKSVRDRLQALVAKLQGGY
jgi:hypothetical protein